MFNVEWDEAKRRRNLEKRGVDFRRAAMIFASPTLEAPDRRRDYGEARIIALGQVAAEKGPAEFYVVVYTWRGDVRRIISAWKAGRDEQSAYRAALTSRG